MSRTTSDSINQNRLHSPVSSAGKGWQVFDNLSGNDATATAPDPIKGNDTLDSLEVDNVAPLEEALESDGSRLGLGTGTQAFKWWLAFDVLPMKSQSLPSSDSNAVISFEPDFSVREPLRATLSGDSKSPFDQVPVDTSAFRPDLANMSYIVPKVYSQQRLDLDPLLLSDSNDILSTRNSLVVRDDRDSGQHLIASPDSQQAPEVFGNQVVRRLMLPKDPIKSRSVPLLEFGGTSQQAQAKRLADPSKDYGHHTPQKRLKAIEEMPGYSCFKLSRPSSEAAEKIRPKRLENPCLRCQIQKLKVSGNSLSSTPNIGILVFLILACL